MYSNNVHILYYVIIAILGLIVGKFTAWCNIRFSSNKKIFSKEFFVENKKGLKSNYIFMLTTAFIYVFLLYRFGIQKEGILSNLDLIKYVILIPMLLLTICIDIKHRIIPNRLNLTIFELGLIITFLYGITNVNLAKDYILGMIIGGGIFSIITLLGIIIFGKEAMGLGDVKFVGAIGLFYGVTSIAEISLLSFFICAICSIIILLVRIIVLKSKDEYIPFGPFLAISAIICMFIPSNFIFDNFLLLCKFISDKLIFF